MQLCILIRDDMKSCQRFTWEQTAVEVVCQADIGIVEIDWPEKVAVRKSCQEACPDAVHIKQFKPEQCTASLL